MADNIEVKEGDNKDNENMVSKADLDAAVERASKAERDLEDMRMEVVSPDYIEFLDSKEKATLQKKDNVEKDEIITDEKLEKMTKKEILEHAKKLVDGVKREVNESLVDRDRKARDLAVARFSETKDDFEVYRPVMYGLSTDPKHSGKSLEQLYALAKQHVSGIHAKVSEKEKAEQVAAGGEKPGGGSESWEADKKLTSEQAAQAAAAEVKAKLGPIPLA